MHERSEKQLKQDPTIPSAERIVDAHPHSIIGVEELTHIRERIRESTAEREGRGHVEAATRNRHACQWAFAELQSYIAYKAKLSGVWRRQSGCRPHQPGMPHVVAAPSEPENRTRRGLLFMCQKCHYTLHADLVGASNVPFRTLVVRQDWMSTGVLSVRPDVSCDEAKAARLQRYAELRWSLDTSPSSLDIGSLTVVRSITIVAFPVAYRTNTCGDLNKDAIGQQVTLAGWVNRRRDHGGLVFLDIRDRYGLTQVICDPERSPEAHRIASDFRSEYVVQMGHRCGSPGGTENPSLSTGDIEVAAKHIEILNPSRTTPFPITDTIRGPIPAPQVSLPRLAPSDHAQDMVLRHRVVKVMRDYLDERGFLEI